MTTAPLPDSGDPGGRPPRPETLPTPALWPQGTGADEPFSGLREEQVPSRDPVSVRGSWAATGLMLLGALLLAGAVIRVSLPLGVAGVVVGLGGLVLAWRVRIFAAVDLGTADAQQGGPASGGPASPV